jgi:hypothetical protein
MSQVAFQVSREQVLEITQEVFTAMLDQGETLTFERFEPVPDFADPLFAWVEMHADSEFGAFTGRAVVKTETETAHEITRSLLMLAPDEEVTEADLTDAFGEIANVVGGNVKALIDAVARLTLPQVGATPPAEDNAMFLQDLAIDWRGRVPVVSLWVLL